MQRATCRSWRAVSSAVVFRAGARRGFANIPPPPPPHSAPMRNSSKGIFIRNAIVLGSIGFGIGYAISEFALSGDSSDEDRAKAMLDLELAPTQSEITERVFLDISLPSLRDSKQQVVERVIIGLYGKEVPITATNFLKLCEGFTKQSNADKTITTVGYENCRIHRVIPGFMMQSGDYTTGDGTGGASIYDTTSFRDESFALTHKGLGVLSMANRGPHTNSSQFFICFKETPWLNGRHVVFGQVLSGASTLRRVESFGSKSGKPSADMHIVHCGKLPPLEESAANNVNPNDVIDETGRNARSIMK